MRITDETKREIDITLHKEIWKEHNYRNGVCGFEVETTILNNAIITGMYGEVCRLEEIGDAVKELTMLYEAITKVTGVEF